MMLKSRKIEDIDKAFKGTKKIASYPPNSAKRLGVIKNEAARIRMLLLDKQISAKEADLQLKKLHAHSYSRFGRFLSL